MSNEMCNIFRYYLNMIAFNDRIFNLLKFIWTKF